MVYQMALLSQAWSLCCKEFVFEHQGAVWEESYELCVHSHEYIFPRYIWSSSTFPENFAVLKVKWLACHVNETFAPPPSAGGLEDEPANRQFTQSWLWNEGLTKTPEETFSACGTRMPPWATEPGPNFHKDRSSFIGDLACISLYLCCILTVSFFKLENMFSWVLRVILEN